MDPYYKWCCKIVSQVGLIGNWYVQCMCMCTTSMSIHQLLNLLLYPGACWQKYSFWFEGHLALKSHTHLDSNGCVVPTHYNEEQWNVIFSHDWVKHLWNVVLYEYLLFVCWIPWADISLFDLTVLYRGEGSSPSSRRPAGMFEKRKKISCWIRTPGTVITRPMNVIHSSTVYLWKSQYCEPTFATRRLLVEFVVCFWAVLASSCPFFWFHSPSIPFCWLLLCCAKMNIFLTSTIVLLLNILGVLNAFAPTTTTTTTIINGYGYSSLSLS